MSIGTPRCAANPAPTSMPTASRASWIGALRLGRLTVPVKAYSTISTPESRLHQVHQGCGRQIVQRRCCPEHGEIRAEEITKAYAYAADRLIQLTPQELGAVAPSDDKTIVLERFFQQDQLDLTLIAGRSLYLAPENPAGAVLYGTVLIALANSQKWALGRVVFSGRRQLIVIRPDINTLVLHTLYDPAQRRAPVRMQRNGNGSDKGEVRAIQRLMEQASGPIAWHELCDDADQRLARLVADKVQADQARVPTAPRLAKHDSRNSRPRRKAKAA